MRLPDGKIVSGDGKRLPGRPALQAAKMAGDLLQYDSDLGQVTFRRRLMQIQPQRLAQSVRMIP